MKTTKCASYYNSFNCIGGTCPDSCCIGWQIPIDEGTYNRYKKVKNPTFKRRLEKELVKKKGSVSIEHVAKIKLKNNRCAFLDQEGWCDIYRELGEGALSHTCELYPRTMNQVGETIEYSMTTSCPEACRLILMATTPIRFDEVPSHIGTQLISGQCKEINREIFLEMMQDRTKPFEVRLSQLGEEVANIKAESVLKSSREMLELAVQLKQLFKSKKCRQPMYEDLLEKVLRGLKLDENIVFSQAKVCYEQQEITHYKPFLEEHESMLENYFSNYIYERLVPLDQPSVKQSMACLILYYHLIKLHLIGISVEERLTPENVIHCIQQLTKVYDHGEGYTMELQQLW